MSPFEAASQVRFTTMYYDIVGSLPHELLLCVVEHLDLKDIVRNQRVSKRWAAIFSCHAVIGPALREALACLDLDQEVDGTNITFADTRRYLGWGYSLQHARPVKKIFLPWPEGSPDEFLCHSRRLCYRVSESNELVVLNLESGERSIWTVNETDEWRSLSSRYLIVGNAKRRFDYVTALDISTNKTLFSQRIRRLCPSSYVIIEDMVVVASLSSDKLEPIYIWDLRQNHVQGIGNFTNLSLYYMSATENVLVAFESVGRDQPTKVQQTKWNTTNGQLLEKKVFHLQLPADCPRRSFTDPNFCRIYNHKSVACFVESFDRFAVTCLEYDYTVDQLSVRCTNRAEPIRDSKRKGGICFTRLTGSIEYRYLQSKCQVAVCDAAAGKVTLHPVQVKDDRIIRIRSLSNPTPYDPCYLSYFETFGDREVFGLANHYGVQLWFFNPSFAPDPLDWKIWNAEEYEIL